MEKARRKVQMFTAEQVEVLRSYLAHKATEPPPQPEMLMMGGDCTSCVPRTEEAEGKRLLAEGAGACFGREGRRNLNQRALNLPDKTCTNKRRNGIKSGL
jgi:hypothetical protein